MNKEAKTKLVQLADSLDRKGFMKEAQMVDRIITDGQKKMEGIRKDLEAFLKVPILYRDGAFRVTEQNRFKNSTSGDIVCYYEEGDEALLGCCANDCNVDDFWKGDLTNSRGYLNSKQLQQMHGKTFGGLVFADEFFC